MKLKHFFFTISFLLCTACQPALQGFELKKGTKQFITECPQINIVEDLRYFYELPVTNDIDENTSFSEAEIASASATCHIVDASQLIISLDAVFTAHPGPFAELLETKPFQVTYFIAVLDKRKNILSKDRFNLDINFADNGQQQSLEITERLKQIINIENNEQHSDYSILVGFQLSEAQLKYARKLNEITEIHNAPSNDPLLLR